MHEIDADERQAPHLQQALCQEGPYPHPTPCRRLAHKQSLLQQHCKTQCWPGSLACMLGGPMRRHVMITIHLTMKSGSRPRSIRLTTSPNTAWYTRSSMAPSAMASLCYVSARDLSEWLAGWPPLCSADS